MHLKFWINEASAFLIFDKIFSLWIFFAYWIDLFSIVTVFVNYLNHKPLQEKKISNTDEEKMIISKMIASDKIPKDELN